MLKKLVLWSLYSAFLGLLLAGAMYRTSIKLEDGGQNQSRGNQPRQESSGAGKGQSANKLDAVNANVEEHEYDINETTIVVSQVLDISKHSITLQLTDGLMVNVAGRAWRYAQGFGFSTQVNDTLWLEGFSEGDYFVVTRMINLKTSQSVSLRDETGHPLWNGN